VQKVLCKVAQRKKRGVEEREMRNEWF